MTWSISDLFPDWGEAGSSPSDGFFYEGGDQVNEKHMDYLWNSLDGLQDEVRSALTDIDSDKDGVVDEADSAQSASTDFNLAGNALTDTSQDYLDLTGDGNDLRLATGQAIEDGGGTKRLALTSDRTKIFNDAGNKIIESLSGTSTRLWAYSSEPLKIFDAEAGQSAVQYDTDASTGTFRLTGANLQLGAGNVLQGTGTNPTTIFPNRAGSNASMDVRINDTSEFFAVRDNTNNDDIAVFNPLGPIDFSGQGNNLRLATGQSIEDGSGVNRLRIGGTTTILNSGDGSEKIDARDGYLRLNAYSASPVQIDDRGGNFNALTYMSSSGAPGTLELTNADLDISGHVINNANKIQTDYNEIVDAGIGTLASPSSGARIWVDTDDGDLKVTFANGTTQTIATN